MPIHQFVADKHLVERGLTNYWGYNSIGFFAPDIRYASAHEAGAQVDEFKTMVKILHEEGIEVILDVVYNHTAEGNHLGPTLCFRGLDNAAYYRLNDDRRYYMDYTGCGNTLDMTHPRALQLLMDSLRYWIQEMRVDGFRFDLASALARELDDVDRLGSFFDIIHQDPVISQVKLIAEPWDLGEGGYQVGNFPNHWAEWNGVYRDTVRAFWKGDEGQAGNMGHRLTGSLARDGEKKAAVRLDQLRDRARRLHAARPRLLQRQAQRGQRRGRPRRRRPQSVLEPRCRGPHRRREDPRAPRAPDPQLPGHAAAVSGRADDLRRRRDRPHAAWQ
jgi:glycogen debranching enzyme GlgX